MKKNSWESRLVVALALVLAIGLCAACALADTISGTCGENLNWTLDDEGTLTISGSGAMASYQYATDSPWASLTSSIKTLIIEDGVTSIGNRAFCSLTQFTSISIPNSMTSIG